MQKNSELAGISPDWHPRHLGQIGEASEDTNT
jgi:hypothetical protein